MAVVVMLILVIAVPLVIAQVTQTKNIHVTGSANYPSRPSSTSTPAPTVTSSPGSTPTVKFSLFFPNGTAYPTAINNANWFRVNVIDPTVTSTPQPLSNGPITVRNDGNVPIKVVVAASNVNVPSNIQFLITDGGGNPGTIGIGQSGNLYFVIDLTVTNSPLGQANPQAGQPFSYGFDVGITATQA